jgi:hypothetical protein
MRANLPGNIVEILMNYFMQAAFPLLITDEKYIHLNGLIEGEVHETAKFIAHSSSPLT